MVCIPRRGSSTGSVLCGHDTVLLNDKINIKHFSWKIQNTKRKHETCVVCWPTNVYKAHIDKSATPSVRFLLNRPCKHRRYHHHHRFHFSSLFRLHFSPDEFVVFFFLHKKTQQKRLYKWEKSFTSKSFSSTNNYDNADFDLETSKKSPLWQFFVTAE